MRLVFDDIIIANNLLVNKGQVNIKRGETILLSGANGCGKTSLVKNIVKNNKEYRIRLVDQNNNGVFETLDIVQNISFSNDDELVKTFLKDAGFDYLLHYDLKTLSGGEKRS